MRKPKSIRSKFAELNIMIIAPYFYEPPYVICTGCDRKM